MGERGLRFEEAKKSSLLIIGYSRKVEEEDEKVARRGFEFCSNLFFSPPPLFHIVVVSSISESKKLK